MWSIIHRWKKEVIRWSSFMAGFIVAHLNCVQFERGCSNQSEADLAPRQISHSSLNNSEILTCFFLRCMSHWCFSFLQLLYFLRSTWKWYHIRIRFAGVASLINFLLIWVKDLVVTPIMVVLWRDDLCWVGALSWLFQCWMIIRNLRNHAFHTEMSDNFQKQKHAAYFIYVFQSTKKHTKGS